MQIVGTKEAFIAMLDERGIYKKLEVERSTVSSWKIRMKSGVGVSLDKMEEMLIKAGATVVKEKVWEVETHRKIFTSIEAEEIKNYLNECRKSGRADQKNIRGHLRANFGFYISDFDNSKFGFTSDDFDQNVLSGAIEIKD